MESVLKMSENSLHIYISCSPGIEPILVKECHTLGLKTIPVQQSTQTAHAEEDSGGILVEGSLADVYRSNLYMRTASRITVRLGEFYAAAFSELRKKASRLEWERFLTPGQIVNLSVTCHKSKLYHSDAVAERVLGAINDHFSTIAGSKSLCRTEKSGQLILVRLVNDLCTISIDSSGTPLYKRGYRQEVAKAPLRETLAAALLLGSDWEMTTSLIDPFCGSGTIPIEASLMANNIPPGFAREFAFIHWPNFDKPSWEDILRIAKQGIIDSKTTIIGYDRDQGAIQMASSNAARAGQKDYIVFKRQPISDLEPSGAPGWVITNPPYGIRTHQNKDLRDLYARFGSLLTSKFKGWKAGILCSDRKLTGNLGLAEPVSTFYFINGGIPVEYRLFSL